jgi:hypothetical protein
MNAITGGCLCGAVRYETMATPVMAGLCHCRNCQRVTSSGFAPQMAFPEASFRVAGELRDYDLRADSGNTVRKSFCPTCGANILSTNLGMPGFVFVLAGTLDEPSRYEPAVQVFTESAQHWAPLADSLPRFDRMPPPELMTPMLG